MRLGTLRVHGARSLTTVGGSSVLELMLDSLQLTAAPTLEDVLREIPMLHVRTNSRGESEILARGSESRQVAVLVDGVPLTLNWDARADVSMIPASAPGELAFTRGLGSMLYGPNVLGGVIELTIAGEHSVHANYTGNQFCLASTGDDVALPAATRLGGAVTRQWTVRAADRAALLSRTEARLAVHNLTNAAVWDQCGLPQSGRVMSLVLRVF
ncbi:hypothetical protein BH23GEM9_BH23GEM9_04470 [soil metagenome]